MRRAILAVIAALLIAPLTAQAQSAAKVWRVGLLWPGASIPPPPRMESFRQGFREAGYVEGQNFAIEVRHSDMGSERLRALADELVALNVDVIVAAGDLAPRAAQQATAATPIVAMADDVLGAGLIASLSRPGGNTTGMTILSPELSAKRLELLKALFPRLSRVAALWDPTTGRSQVTMTQAAAQALQVKLQILEVRSRADLAAAFQAARRERAEALNVFSSPTLASLYRPIVELAAENRLAAIYQWREHAEAGGLASYGPSLAGMWHQTAHLAAKILKGAKPGNLPVEQPTKLELAINMKTARSLGLTVPPALLGMADRIIE